MEHTNRRSLLEFTILKTARDKKMKLSNRQQKMISEMVEKEAKAAVNSRDLKYEILGKSNKIDLLFEEGHEPSRVDNSILEEAVQDKLDDSAMKVASSVLQKFKPIALNAIAAELNRHGMASEVVTMRQLDDFVSEIDESMELAIEIKMLLLDYASKLSTVIVDEFGG
jgi:hypothetical protein